MDSKNTLISLSSLGYNEHLIRNINFKVLLDNFNNLSIRIIDEMESSETGINKVEESFNFLCQPLLLNDEGQHFELNNATNKEESEIVFL
jgi:hypothetical protein